MPNLPAHTPFVLLLAAIACPVVEAAQWIEFQQQAIQPGDVSVQQLEFQLQLEMSIRQNEQTVDSRKQQYRKVQRRRLTVLKTDAQHPTHATLEYLDSESVVTDREDTPERRVHPVAGKSYRVQRVRDQLVITDQQGNTPPDEELAQVAHDMQHFGLPNPFAAFLSGRRIQIGQRLQLPTELAAQLLGPQDQVGRVTRFELRLDSASAQSGRQVAHFSTVITIQPENQEGLDMHVQGQLAMDVATSRLAGMNLSGPVEFEETFGPEEGQFSVVTAGQMRMQARVDLEIRR